jgi:hypothetical protein
MFCFHISENRPHMREISDVFLLHKSLQYSFSTAWDVFCEKGEGSFSEGGVNFRIPLCNFFAVPRYSNHVVKAGKKHSIFLMYICKER